MTTTSDPAASEPPAVEAAAAAQAAAGVAGSEASAPAITAADAYPKRLLAWIGERHGPALLIPVFLLYGLAIAVGATVDGATDVPAWQLILGGVAAWTWFLVLRILDDLGDLETDRTEHPERLLSRGVVQPGELGTIAAIGIVAQAVISLAIDGGVGVVTLVWTGAMLFIAAAALDFGAKSWMEARPMLARMLRVPATAFPVLWWSEMGSGGATPDAATGVLIIVALLGIVVVDFARKLKPGESVSWTDELGAPRANATLAVLIALLAGSAIGLLAVVGITPIAAVIVLAASGVIGVAGALRGAGKAAGPIALLLVLATSLITIAAGS